MAETAHPEDAVIQEEIQKIGVISQKL